MSEAKEAIVSTAVIVGVSGALAGMVAVLNDVPGQSLVDGAWEMMKFMAVGATWPISVPLIKTWQYFRK